MLPVSDVLYCVRNYSGLSQRELSMRSNLSTAKISRYESGECKPSIFNFIHILNVCGFDIQIIKHGDKTPVEFIRVH